MNEKILIAPTTFGASDRSPVALLEAAGFTLVWNETGRRMTAAEVMALGQGCAGIISGLEPLNAEVLARLPGLRCISRCGVGLDNIDLEAARVQGIDVRTTPGAPTEAVAELTIGLMLALLRDIPAGNRCFHEGAWKKGTGFLLRARTVGLVGAGRIGRAVADRLRPFGCRLLAADPCPDVAACARSGLQLMPLAELLGEADVVSLHTSVAPGAPPVIGARELALMPKGAWLINTSRGAAVDEEALVEALRSGHLAGAALDVFREEPYDGPLCGRDRIIGLPHIGSYALETRVAMELESAENLIAVLAAHGRAAQTVGGL